MRKDELRYGAEGEEEMSAESFEEAAEDWFDYWENEGTEEEDDYVEIHEYRGVEVKVHDNFLEEILESLDTEYGSPYGSGNEYDSAAIEQAWSIFKSSVSKAYVPWLMEPTGNKKRISRGDLK